MDLSPFELVCFGARIIMSPSAKNYRSCGDPESQDVDASHVQSTSLLQPFCIWDCCWDANAEERPERATRTDPDRLGTVPPQGSICDDNYTGGHLVWGNQSSNGLLTMTLHYNPCSIMLHMVPDSMSSAEFSGRNKCLLGWIKNCIPCK